MRADARTRGRADARTRTHETRWHPPESMGESAVRSGEAAGRPSAAWRVTDYLARVDSAV
eukprot:6229182-Prymnesium_polylepis.1